MNDNYKEFLLTLKEQFEDEKILDEIDIKYLFEIIDTLELKVEGYTQALRNKGKEL